MGSKRAMLSNGLGTLLKLELPKYDRFIDLFCGSGCVSWFAATNSSIRVDSVDLQSYATSLAAAVTFRTRPFDASAVKSRWLDPVNALLSELPVWQVATQLDQATANIQQWCRTTRRVVVDSPLPEWALVTRCYGGHYFSLSQSLLIDAMKHCLPSKKDEKAVCLAAILITASKCAASPGHTAQPFQPTKTSRRHLRDAWMRNPIKYATQAIEKLSTLHASVRGSTHVGDAVRFANQLSVDDLVFVDPPYSAVHYSRFYHVLETISRGRSGDVTGVGRYPPASERPASAFSRKGESKEAINQLLDALAKARATVVLTYPMGHCSNGLNGMEICDLAKRRFRVENRTVDSCFSTLGGNNSTRSARQKSRELILLLRPRAIRTSKL
jgi:adenine-specific DNA-methyltransferase